MTMQPLPDDLDHFITMTPRGIEYQTVFLASHDREFLDLLHLVIEDNIVEYDDEETMEWRERIDWAGVRRDWEGMKP